MSNIIRSLAAYENQDILFFVLGIAALVVFVAGVVA